MRKLTHLFPLLALVALLTSCGDEESGLVEPQTFSLTASSGSISGDVLGPDGSDICGSFPDGWTLRVDVIDPVNATSESPLAGEQFLACPNNAFSIDVPSGTYVLRVQLPREPGIGALPWRYLEPGDVVVNGAAVVKDIQVLEGTDLGGVATRDGFLLMGAWLTLRYDFASPKTFSATHGASGPDGAWDDRETWRSPLSVQGGLTYRTSCPRPWPSVLGPDDVGYRLTEGPPDGPFLFPDDVEGAIDCTYESISDVPDLGVDVNNYQLVLRPNDHPPQLGTGFFADGVAADAVLYGGGVAYTTDAAHTFILHDPRGSSEGNILGTGVPPMEVLEPGNVAEHQTLTVLREWPEDSYWNATALDLLVVRETYAWSGDDYIIFKYTVFNPGSEPVEGITAGLVLDQDLTAYTHDHVWHNYVEYDRGSKVVVVNEPWYQVWAGHAMLGTTSGYRSWSNPTNAPAGAPIDPVDLSTWNDYLTDGIVDAGVFGPADVRHLLSIGPGTLAPGSTGAFATVLVGGRDRDGVLDNVVSARTRYGALPEAARSPYPVLHVGVEASKVKPSKDHFEATFTFADPSTAKLFDASSTYCSGAQATSSKRMGSTVAAQFPKAGLDSWVDDGDQIVCVGRLADGSLFGGADVARIE